LNAYKAFLSLFPTQQRFYGEIVSQTSDFISVSLLGSGIMAVPNSGGFSPGDSVWVISDRGDWILETAPEFSSYEVNI
jgi:hypothetical protein